MSGWIVEVEAYLSQGDEASHSYRGLKNRNRSMFEVAGTVYVYSIHAKYCLNIVTEEKGVGAAILIRAVEPEEGMEWMHQNRPGVEVRDLLRGPGKTCQAMSIDLRCDGHPLGRSAGLWIENPEDCDIGDFSVRTSKRIGIQRSADLPYRFFVDGNRFVSGLARDHSRPPRESFRPLVHARRQEADGTVGVPRDRNSPED